MAAIKRVYFMITQELLDVVFFVLDRLKTENHFKTFLKILFQLDASNYGLATAIAMFPNVVTRA